ncbi:hypothetical protein GKD63_21885 [Parabacteroides distasonis]|nr:hypothetical protein [Parabacteroides distasonis]
MFLILSKSNSSFIKKTVLAKLILFSFLTQFKLHSPHVLRIVLISLFYLRKEREELCVLRVLCGEIEISIYLSNKYFFSTACQ